MELLTGKLLFFVMVLTRISAFFLVVPVFGWVSIPVRIKVAMALLLAFFFSMVTPMSTGFEGVSTLEAVLLIVNESIYGLALGLIVAVLFAAVKLGGRIVEDQIGLSMAEIVDPLTEETAQPLGSFLEMIFVILFLSANGHHLLLLIIQRSYQTFPAGKIPTIGTLAGGVIQAGSAMLVAGLQIAAPMLAAFLLLVVVLAVLARVEPEMNILFISLSLRVGLGFVVMVIFLPFFGSYVSELAGLMNKLLPL
jgi:flagellar biosynthetic protein FliR